MADDHGIFSPWRFRPEGTDVSPGGWYFKAPGEAAQVGPFETRREAKAESTRRRKVWGLYIPDQNGNRPVYFGEDGAVILDRLDSRDWLAGSVEERHRFAVILKAGAEPQYRSDLAAALDLLTPPDPWEWVWGLEPGDRVRYGADGFATVISEAEESKHGRDFAPVVHVQVDDGEDEYADADEISPITHEA